MKKDNLSQLAFRLNLRTKLKKQPIELIHITKEECIKEIERRNKQ